MPEERGTFDKEFREGAVRGEPQADPRHWGADAATRR